MPTLYSALQRGRMMFWIFLPEFVGSARLAPLDPSWPDSYHRQNDAEDRYVKFNAQFLCRYKLLCDLKYYCGVCTIYGKYQLHHFFLHHQYAISAPRPYPYRYIYLERQYRTTIAAFLTMLMHQAPWGGGGDWGRCGAALGWRGKRGKIYKEAEQTKLVNTQREKEKTDWNCGTKDQKTKGGPQKAVVMVWQPKLGVTKEKCGELKVKWESEGNFLKWHLFHILKTGKLRPKLLNHRCSMFFTRTILTILGLWNPRPNPDEVRKI